MKVAIASDHAGLNLKTVVREHLQEQNFEVADLGPQTNQSVDYSSYALTLARAVAGLEYDQGILICGTGLGMSMAANRVKGVRAALCCNEYMARMARAHNNANVLCFGERVIGQGLALAIVDAWLATEFEGGRHQRRIDIFDRV